ncbi:MAG: dTDP-4-dehydrorhamnose reductase [Deltaproteobacteria bacterium]|nr:dTDP-4-dehydrorhamnose reductase [Deltaproteobacteria bacterium]
MKILITGGEGQVGRDLQALLSQDFEVVALGKGLLDISKEEGIARALQEHRPGLMVNAAAFTKVDACETERDLAWKINAEGPGLLGWACRKRGLPLLHLSTDYVFDGAKSPLECYVENDPTGPLSFYGLTKLEGERQILGSGVESLILRTSWVYGIHGANFLKAVLKRALSGQALRVVNDQWGAPTWSHRIAVQIRRLIRSESGGIYHAAAEGATTWYEVAREFFDLMKVEARLSPCTTAEYPTPARRPANSRLANRRLINEGLSEMRDWKEDLAAFVTQYRDRLIEEARAS